MNTERARAIVGGVFLGYRAEIVERLRTDVPVQVFEVRTEVDAPGFPGGSIVVASGRRDAPLMRSLLAAGEAGDAATARRTPGSAPTRAANPAGRRLGVQTSIGRGTSHAGAAVRVGGDEAWCGLARPQPAASRQPASNSATIDRIHTPDDMSLSRLLSQAIGLAAQIASPWATPLRVSVVATKPDSFGGRIYILRRRANQRRCHRRSSDSTSLPSIRP